MIYGMKDPHSRLLHVWTAPGPSGCTTRDTKAAKRSIMPMSPNAWYAATSDAVNSEKQMDESQWVYFGSTLLVQPEALPAAVVQVDCTELTAVFEKEAI